MLAIIGFTVNKEITLGAEKVNQAAFADDLKGALIMQTILGIENLLKRLDHGITTKLIKNLFNPKRSEIE